MGVGWLDGWMDGWVCWEKDAEMDIQVCRRGHMGAACVDGDMGVYGRYLLWKGQRVYGVQDVEMGMWGWGGMGYMDGKMSYLLCPLLSSPLALPLFLSLSLSLFPSLSLSLSLNLSLCLCHPALYE